MVYDIYYCYKMFIILRQKEILNKLYKKKFEN